MNGDGTAAVWKALADPTRRAILDLLAGQALTTGELSGAFPEVSRFAVMKHLGVLETAGLVVVRRRGRGRWKHPNGGAPRGGDGAWGGPGDLHPPQRGAPAGGVRALDAPARRPLGRVAAPAQGDGRAAGRSGHVHGAGGRAGGGGGRSAGAGGG